MHNVCKKPQTTKEYSFSNKLLTFSHSSEKKLKKRKGNTDLSFLSSLYEFEAFKKRGKDGHKIFPLLTTLVSIPLEIPFMGM